MGILLCFLSMILTSQALYLLPITKHEPTKQFYTTLQIGTNVTTQLNLLLDLGTNLTWLNCHELKSLKSLHNVACGSLSCEDVPGNGCNGGNSCLYQQPNPLGGDDDVTGHVVQDSASFSTTDGISQASLRIFTFSCASENDLQGFAPQVSGVLSLSPGTSSLARQVATQVDGISKLSLCLPSYGATRIPPSTTNPIQKTLTPMTTDSGDYLITVQSMYVGGTPLTLNTNVATRLSTVVPYTVLQTDIYKALAMSFTLEAKAMGISKVSPVAPFKDCFDAVAAKGMTRPETLNVPKIEIGLPGMTGGEVKWGFYGANTMVKVTEMVMCLAFHDDGGKNPKDWIVMGTHQLQDYMLEFDFGASTFSFSDSLLLHDTTCST